MHACTHARMHARSHAGASTRKHTHVYRHTNTHTAVHAHNICVIGLLGKIGPRHGDYLLAKRVKRFAHERPHPALVPIPVVEAVIFEREWTRTMYVRTDASAHGTLCCAVLRRSQKRPHAPRSRSHRIMSAKGCDSARTHHPGTAVSLLSQLPPTRAPSPTAWFSMALALWMNTATRMRVALATALRAQACLCGRTRARASARSTRHVGRGMQHVGCNTLARMGRLRHFVHR